MKQVIGVHILLLLLIFSTAVTAQAPAITWQRTYGGSYSDFAANAQPTSDGGYVIAGTSQSLDGEVSGNHGGADYWIVKTDVNGVIEWKKSYGGLLDETATAIKQTSDGGYIVAGSSNSYNGDVTNTTGNGTDYWILKLKPDGEIEWEKSYGGRNRDDAKSICQTTDGGYIVAGYTQSNDRDVSGNHSIQNDYWVIKLDPAGNLQWQRCYGGVRSEMAYAVQQTTDGGYVVAGFAQSNDGDISINRGGDDFWVLKIYADGNIQWQKIFGGTGEDRASSIQQTAEGGYIVGGYTRSPVSGDVSVSLGIDDYWLIKLSATGNLEWEKTYGGSDNERMAAVQQTRDGGYIATGYTNSANGDITARIGSIDYWAIKLDNAGGLKWQKSFGGSYSDYGTSITQTSDGGYIVSGQTFSNDVDVSGNHGSNDYWIVKLEASATLPVHFGTVDAYIKKGILQVKWQTLTETNNNHYLVEASEDGLHFKPISEKIISKAPNGNSSTPLSYSFSVNITAYAAMGLALFFALGFSVFKNKKWKIALAYVAILACMAGYSCTKDNNNAVNNEQVKLFIRIAQVDKDGTVKYSKIVQAAKED